MNCSMNLLLWTTHVTEEHFPLLEKLKAAGFDGVEIPIFEGDESHFRKIGAKLKELGLRATAVTVMSAETNPVSSDAGVRRAAGERLKWAIGNLAALGGEILCGPLHSALGVFSGTGPTADEKARCVEVMRAAADHAAQANAYLAVEYLNRFECYFLTTAADTVALADAVNHPHFHAMYDTFHANIEEKAIAPAITSMRDHLIHVHISENDRGTPGTGHVHWAETFKALKSLNYRGWLTIEAFGRAMPALAAATRVWRDLFPHPDEVYTKGLAFIKESWAKA